MIKKKQQFDLITIGGATVDICFYSKEGELVAGSSLAKQKLLAFEYGAKIVADRLYTTCGGGAANAAVSASRLGLRAAAISRIGQDGNGQIVIKNLKTNNVSVGLLRTDSQESTGFSVVLTIDNAAKEHIAFIHRGANSHLTAADIPSSLPSDWLYVTSLPADSWQAIMSKLIKSGKKIVWNPGNEQLKDIAAVKKFLPKIKLLMLNRTEALEFRKLKDVKGLLSHLQSFGPEFVVITDSANGAYAFDGGKYYYMKSRSAKTINTLGVGDAFGSALTSALIHGKTVKEALVWGTKNSASVVSKIGAQAGLLTKSQISK